MATGSSDVQLHGGVGDNENPGTWQQLAAYVSWVNSQLRRKPGLNPISDLRRDLQDGVIFIHLIEIIAGEVLDGVSLVPQDREESRKNVECVLQFILSKHIRMPHISARDIVDGNLKSVMRIILALAAHFKPSANHRAAYERGRISARAFASHNPLSTVALAQGAAAALATARHDASQPARYTHLHRWGMDEERGVCVRALVEQYERGSPDEPDTTEPSSLSSISPLSSPRVPPCSHPEDKQQDSNHQRGSRAEPSQVVVRTIWEDSFHETLETEIEETRKMVSALQALLLHGSLPEDEQQSVSLEEDNAEQQLVVIRSHLDQSMEEARELKRELLHCKQEIRNLQGVKEAQQQRLCSQEASILQMKQELLRASMAKDELNNQNAELQWKLEECNRLWGESKKETVQKDKLLQQHKHKFEENQKQQSELQRELEHKNSMLQELMSQDLHQQMSPNTENHGHSRTGNPGPVMSGQAEELQLVRDALRSLRNNFREHDPQHHTLDTLEQGIASLIDRLQVLHSYRGRGKSPRRKAAHTDPDAWPCTKTCHSQSSPASTKILYFTGQSPTPSMINISKRLGEVTLKDVKAAVDQEGNYRYHFKALDPEFGTVKEEVFLDEAVVPGWEGKIVAWVEEDNSEERPL
ncbi:dixin-like [Lampris incognitus]|uniref:dixin-like n=1 Tax=Lampris incognitus TaxID=2546036 RepID=UPI0024B531FB|nr:dixin-like [Lampris incognitus]